MEPIQESASGEQGLLASGMRRAEGMAENRGTWRAGIDDLASVAHDACNMLTALGLYCELLDEPGVLRPVHRHYVDELRMVAASGRKLVEKLTGLRALEYGIPFQGKIPHVHPALIPSATQDLASELKVNCSLLAALAGPSVSLEILTNECHLPVQLAAEDLTRVLVNLVKNACEAMPKGGRIEISLEVTAPGFDLANAGRPPYVLLIVSDTGEGISAENQKRIFESGYTTKVGLQEGGENWHSPHRGLGLAIVRSLIEEAGGRVSVDSFIGKGTRFVIELPTVAQ